MRRGRASSIASPGLRNAQSGVTRAGRPRISLPPTHSARRRTNAEARRTSEGEPLNPGYQPSVCTISTTLRMSTAAVAITARLRVNALFANVPMISFLPVKMMSEIIGNGSAIDSTT